MFNAINAIRFKKVRRTLLAIATASGTLCAANPALAACAIAPGGTGTVANPGPNSIVVCTGTTTGINVATTSAGAQVQIEGGAQVNGIATSSEIYLDGGDNRVTVGNGATLGPAILTDTNIVVFGSNAGLYVEGGSLVDLSGNPLLQINVVGANAALGISGASQVIVPRPIAIFGSNASFYLDPTSTLSAASNFTGSSLIAGDSGSQTFYIEGKVETLGTSAIENIVNAGDGDDTILLTNVTRFTTGSSATLTPTYMLNGNGGNDTLVLDNIFQTLDFSSTGIELLAADGGIGGISRIRGSHEFQEIRVVRGQLDVTGEAALGVPGSTLNVLTDGRLRFFGSGSSVLTQQIIGAGVFDYAGGSNEFATGNTLGGQFIISGGTPLISNSAAFGSASVNNIANVIFRDVNITNVLSGNGNYIIDGTASSLGGTNRMNGTITVQSGRLTVTDVSHLANGQVSTPAAIVIAAQGSLNLDLQSNGTLANALSGTGTLNKSSVGNMTINRSNSAYSGAVNLLGGRVFISASDALGTGTIRFSGSIVDFTNTADIIVANTITSAPGAVAVFEKNGAGRTTLTGNNSGMTAQFALNQGVIAVNSVAALGTGGNATLGGTSGIEVNNSADEALLLRITNVIPSVGTFRKLGAGRLTIGDLFQVGTLAVDAGSLRVNQTITAANASIASGARLDGTGRIIGNLTNNGTVAPGNSIGTLTVQGNYVHNSGSVLEIEFDANGNIDLLAVTGTATLNGGTLRFVSLGGAEGSGGTFLTATGGVTGTFASVQTVGAQLPLAVIYQTNNAIMAPSVLTARPSTFNAQFLAAADSAFGFADRVSGSAASGPDGKHLWLQGFGADGNRSASGLCEWKDATMPTWIAPGSGTWTNAANWLGGVPSVAGSSAVFSYATNTGGYVDVEILGSVPAISVGIMDITMTGTTGLTIRGSLADSGASPGVLIFSNPGVQAQLNITTQVTTAPTTFSSVQGLRMQLDSDLAVNVATAGSTAIFDLFISGTGKLIKSGAGQLNLPGSVSFTGGIDIVGGVLQAYGVSGSLGSGDITISNNATFRLGGTINNSIGTFFFLSGAAGSAQIVVPSFATATLTGGIEHLSGGKVSFGSATDDGTIVASLGISFFNSNGGGFVIAGGTLEMGNAFNAANFLNSRSGGLVEVAAGATLDTRGFATSILNLDLDGGTVRASSGALILTVNDNFGTGNAQIGTIQGTGGADQFLINAALGYSLDPITFVNWTVGIDTITLNGSAVDNSLIGSMQRETINGLGGNDTIRGTGGIDTINGGAGNDTIRLEATSSGSFIDGGTGTDTLEIFFANLSLGSLSGIEAVNLLGNAQLTLTSAQFASGLAPNSMLSGAGTIFVNMSLGNQSVLARAMTVLGGSTLDMVINGTSGVDVIKASLGVGTTIIGDAGTDQLVGGGLGDVILGGGEIDKIRGDGGADFLNGGAGADVFKYRNVSDSGTGANADTIADFLSGTDRLNFGRIDPDVVTPGDQAFAYIGTAAFANNGTAQLRWVDLGADIRVEVDVNGDTVADMHVLLQFAGAGVLTVADFVL